ncbi:MAG: phage late control D family protein [Caldilineaceae bacterium]|nr:phage late control D family protein [Caldilineaceae bacterium]
MTNGTNGAPPGYYAARPRLFVADRFEQALGDGFLLSLLVEETTLGLFRCEARFSNWGPEQGKTFLFFDRDLLDFGKSFAVELGPPDRSQRVFDGRIMALEAHYPGERPPELTVLAEDRFQDLRMERRTRSFEDLADADIIRQIAAQHGLTADVDLDGPTYGVVTQLNQSDLAFLRERVAAVDGELWIEEDTLHAQARTRRNQGELTLQYGGNLLEFSVLADLAHQRTAVQVSGWDVANKQAIQVTADESLLHAELNGDQSGSALLATALAERHEQIVCAVPFSQEEAQSLADARYRARARRFVRGTGTVDGEPALRVGTTVNLTDLGTLFEGAYYVTLVRHTFDLMHGYRTTFEAERVGLGNS